MENFYISAKLYFYFILRDPTQMLHFKLVANSSDLAATLANLVEKPMLITFCGVAVMKFGAVRWHEI